MHSLNSKLIMPLTTGSRHSIHTSPWHGKQVILELFHAKQADDPSSVAVLMTANSFEVFDEFMKNAAEDIAASGHILESTEVTMYEN